MNGREQFLDDYDVPRGTALLFDGYAALLKDWQSRMNLIAPSTIDQLWHRHFADSAQLVNLVSGAPRTWLDMGSGAGFPGIVVGLLRPHSVTLVESVTKKCRFLEAVVDSLELRNISVLNVRVEALTRRYDVISARACASLSNLFELGIPCAHSNTCWLLPKGATVEREVEEARLTFNFSAELVPSRTDPRGRVVVAHNVRQKANRR